MVTSDPDMIIGSDLSLFGVFFSMFDSTPFVSEIPSCEVGCGSSTVSTRPRAADVDVGDVRPSFVMSMSGPCSWLWVVLMLMRVRVKAELACDEVKLVVECVVL